MSDSSIRPRALIFGVSPTDLRLTEALLSALGLEVTLATDGPVALALAVSLSPDLILLQGPEPLQSCGVLSGSLKEHPATAGIPVLLVDTGPYKRDAPDEALLGFGGLVTRPFEDQRLEEAVRTLLHLRQSDAREVPLADQDPVTGLWRHERLVPHFLQRLEDGPDKDYCYLLVQLDGFEEWRGERGQNEACRLAQAVGRVVSERARRSDLVGYVGDGVFSLILVGTGISLGAEAALRLRRQIAFGSFAGWEADGGGPDTSASLGLAGGGNGVKWDQARRRASDALAAAQADGGNCVYFWSHDHPARANDEQIVVPAEWRE